MKRTFTNIKQVWNAIDQGETVYWHNELYKLTVEENHPTCPNFCKRGNKHLRVTCIVNYFGSVLEKSEIPDLFTKRVSK